MASSVSTVFLFLCAALIRRCRATVAVIFTMCTLQLCFCIYSLWFFSVQNFGNYSALLTSFWAAVAAVGILMAL